MSNGDLQFKAAIGLVKTFADFTIRADRQNKCLVITERGNEKILTFDDLADRIEEMFGTPASVDEKAPDSRHAGRSPP